MRGAAGKAVMVLWAALLAFLILTIGQGVWAALLVANLRSAPAVPWAVPVMALALWLMWRYLGGALLGLYLTTVAGSAFSLIDNRHSFSSLNVGCLKSGAESESSATPSR